MTRPAAVAIVGMAIRLPGAEADLTRFWQAVVDGKDCSREVPPGRWILPPEACYDPRPGQPDRVYCRRGYYLDPFVPNLNGLNVDPTWVAQLDPLVQLVLDVGNRAWASARLEQIDRRRVGVVLGNICLPTEHSSALCQALLGPAWGLPPVNAVHPDNRRVAGFPAALLAQALRLGRGGYSLDAACASSLYALYLAVRELQSGRADAMLAGGCCRPDCLYTQMGFAQLRALSSSGRCAPFDAAADGLLVGEGAALFVLKRLQDAIRHGDHIYAVITGIGLSNDRAGNLLAPSSEGQLRAMQRAYQQAGCLPQEVDYIECHATGTPIGDAVEFASLRQLWGNAGWQIGQCVLSSVKATVGHLLTGAGAAALAKVLLALQYRQLPPQANFVRPAPQLAYEGSPFRILTQAQPWDQPRHRPRRAALSAFGFGGINAHLILEEWTSQLALVHTPPRRAVPVAIVGLACRFGPYRNQQQLRDALHGNVVRPPQPKQRGWESAPRPCPSAWAIDHLEFPTGRFRIPPRELEETLPQQLLMLNLADQAVEDSRRATLPNHTFVSPLAPNSARQFSPEHTSTRASPSTQPAHPFILLTTETSKESGHNQTDVGPTKSLSSSPLGVQPPTPLPPAPSMASPLPMELGLRTGVFIGLELDANTMNFHLRWTALAHGRPDDAERISPPLNANRTIGALGSIAASRIARALGVGGPSFVVCNEEASALRAVSLAVQALQDEEIDLAIAGAVDLAADPRCVLPARIDRPGEGGAAFVLKRLTDAQRDGDTIYAIIRGSGSGSDAFAAFNDACQQAEGDRAFPPPLPSSLTVSVVGACGAAQAAADLVAAILSFQSSNINPALKADAATALLASSLPNPAAPRRYSLTAASCTTHLTLLLRGHPINCLIDTQRLSRNTGRKLDRDRHPWTRAGRNYRYVKRESTSPNGLRPLRPERCSFARRRHLLACRRGNGIIISPAV
ncbi:MAG: beta-ketoacyl synthase N-terminal-like domain-containing protein [Thermogemmata sp.]|nr:beta-ketoacyl synthase N-terminal-like domain-containing protein [Thermogemmata sp.]